MFIVVGGKRPLQPNMLLNNEHSGIISKHLPKHPTRRGTWSLANSTDIEVVSNVVEVIKETQGECIEKHQVWLPRALPAIIANMYGIRGY